MANEWVKVELLGANRDGEPRRFVIANATSVSKGSLLGLQTPRTIDAAYTQALPMAGVAAEEHPASVGITSISLWTDGIFTVTASDAVVAGEPIIAAAVADKNKVIPAVGAVSGAQTLGYAFEDIGAGSSGEVRLRL